jgi:hypothetical protein
MIATSQRTNAKNHNDHETGGQAASQTNLDVPQDDAYLGKLLGTWMAEQEVWDRAMARTLGVAALRLAAAKRLGAYARSR